MRLIKMFGLAAVAAIALTAFVGATAAQAEENPHPKIWACKENKPILCTNLYVPPTGGSMHLLSHANKAELKNTGFFKNTETCESDSTVKVLKSEEMKENEKLHGSIIGLTFSKCEGPCSEAKATGLPWSNGELKMESKESDYKLITTEGGALLSGCTFGTKCEYGVPTGGNVTLLGTNTASGTVFKAEGVTLKYKSGSGEGVCGATGTWTAEYVAKAVDLLDEVGKLTEHKTAWWLTLLAP